MQEGKSILVIGGGITGITAAVELAETGNRVILVEKEDYLGGNVLRMTNYFPKLCPPACGLEINFKRIRNNPLVEVLKATTVTSVSGSKGNFTVKLHTRAGYINSLCTSCGKCAEICPVERPDPLNYGKTMRKAAFIPPVSPFPAIYSIDRDLCKKQECSACEKVCEYQAIDLRAEDTFREVQVSSVILASGWKSYDASKIDYLHYTGSEDIVTNVEFERLMASDGPGAGKLLRPSDGKVPSEIAFIQCAGSRDENHLPYCSAVCCSASLKHALNIADKYPDSRISIFYIDLRVSGRNEDFLERVKANKNIELVKGKATALAENGNGRLRIEAEDIGQGIKISRQADLVVLATGMVPETQEIMTTGNKSGFILNHGSDGIYSAGCARKPMDVSSSVKDATAMALKALQT